MYLSNTILIAIFSILIISCTNETNSLLINSDSTQVSSGDTVGNSIEERTGMKKIPAKDSVFLMGDPEDSTGRTMRHVVQFSYDFYIDVHEVTQKKFNEVMSDSENGYQNYTTPSWKEKLGYGDNYPAYYISWYDAVLYCNALSKRENRDTVYSYSSRSGEPGDNCILQSVTTSFEANGFRLPTEAEWEYAYRAGTNTTFYWGNDWNDAYGWYNGNSEGSSHEVGKKSPNSWGLYDMSGNMWEWCHDWYSNTYYENSPETDPVGPSSGDVRVLRGGTWAEYSTYLNAFYRFYFMPDGSFDFVGFRTVLVDE